MWGCGLQGLAGGPIPALPQGSGEKVDAGGKRVKEGRGGMPGLPPSPAPPAPCAPKIQFPRGLGLLERRQWCSNGNQLSSSCDACAGQRNPPWGPGPRTGWAGGPSPKAGLAGGAGSHGLLMGWAQGSGLCQGGCGVPVPHGSIMGWA